jgi:hypothetical protein
MQNITHRQYVRSLYKHLLSEAGIFFDDRARSVVSRMNRQLEVFIDRIYDRTFMVNRIKYRFRACRSVDDIDRIKNKIIEGRKVRPISFDGILMPLALMASNGLTCRP